MDTIEKSIDSIVETAKRNAQAAYLRALRDAAYEVARLTDGDSDAHDAAISDAIRAIEAMKLPECLK